MASCSEVLDQFFEDSEVGNDSNISDSEYNTVSGFQENCLDHLMMEFLLLKRVNGTVRSVSLVL